MATPTNELRLKVGSQVVTILTDKDHPRGYLRKWNAPGRFTPIHMLVAMDPDKVGFLRITDDQYLQFMQAARDLPPHEWEFEVTCKGIEVGGARIPQVVSIRPACAMAGVFPQVTRRAKYLFQCVNDPNILGA